MEPRTEPGTKQPTSPKERWYLRVQGRTLGPLEGEEIRFGLESGEFLPGDKIASSRNPSWLLVGEHPLFGRFSNDQQVSRSKILVPPPSPHLLRNRAPTPPSVAVPAQIPVPPPEVAAPAAMPTPEPLVVPPAVEAPPAASAVKARAPRKKTAKPKKTEAAPLPAPAQALAAEDKAADELDRFLQSLKKPATPEPSPSALVVADAIPARPAYEPIFIREPEPTRASAPLKKKQTERVIQIELKLPERPLHWLLVLAALVVAAALLTDAPAKIRSLWSDENKTRDLKDFRLSDPSSPTNTPFEASDPVPPLKAPTRPQRE
jgi:hypothetical protein